MVSPHHAASPFRDIPPGQAWIQKGCKPEFLQVEEMESFSLYIFYFPRPDAIIGGILVHGACQKMGIKLTSKIIQILGHDVVMYIDVVVPIAS